MPPVTTLPYDLLHLVFTHLYHAFGILPLKAYLQTFLFEPHAQLFLKASSRIMDFSIIRCMHVCRRWRSIVLGMVGTQVPTGMVAQLPPELRGVAAEERTVAALGWFGRAIGEDRVMRRALRRAGVVAEEDGKGDVVGEVMRRMYV